IQRGSKTTLRMHCRLQRALDLELYGSWQYWRLLRRSRGSASGRELRWWWRLDDIPLPPWHGRNWWVSLLPLPCRYVSTCRVGASSITLGLRISRLSFWLYLFLPFYKAACRS